MIQAAQARVSGGWGFFWRAVRPSYWSWRAARSSIWPGLNSSRAAWGTWPSRARTSRMTRHAVRAVTMASFIRASAVSNWLDSMSKPWLFITQNNCSMFQRRRYHPTIRKAASISLTSCVVPSRQWIGFSPGGASYSQTSTTRRVTCGGGARAQMGRARDRHLSKAQFELGGPRLALAGLGFQRQPEAMNHRHRRHGSKQHLVAGQLAVLADADHKVRMGRTRPCKLLIDIAFAVLNMGDVRGLLEDLVGRLDALQPAIGFLLFDRALAAVDRGALAANVYLCPDQPQTVMIVGINRQGRMQEQAEVSAVADRPQAAGAASMALIVQFGGVLDGQDMAPRCASCDFLTAMLVNLSDRHRLIPQPATERYFFSTIPCQWVQPNGELLRHSLRQQCPFFAAVRRRSCQPPNKNIPLPTSRISRQIESHTTMDQRKVLAPPESAGRTPRHVCIDQPLVGRGWGWGSWETAQHC